MIARIPLHALSIITTGFAIFSMFFGSGNLIFPIELGHRTGANVAYGYVRHQEGVTNAYLDAGSYELEVGGERWPCRR